MRHIPAFVFIHRLAIGTATGSSFSPLRDGVGFSVDYLCVVGVSLPRHPLSERGAAQRRGVSHCVASVKVQVSPLFRFAMRVPA
ncbi:MAG: hypothetical protein IKQ53_04780 [Bacteroidales bacterium]|nr:hypothetical protein [Bacteroidales bacterium]